jgi:tight adherence protein B
MPGGLDPTTAIAIGIGLVSSIVMLLLVRVAVAGGNSRRFTRRLQEVTTRKPQVARAGGTQQRSMERRESATPGIDRIFRLLPRREMLVERLARTGRDISVGQYMLVTFGSIAVMTLGVGYFAFAKFGAVPTLMFGVALGMFIPHWLIGRMGKKRVARFVALFPEAIDLMVRALRAGLPITEAIVNAGQEIGDPIGVEFRGIESGMKLGRDLDSLLWDIAKRIEVSEFRFFIIALSVQRETGGNLAETLNNLSVVLRGRRAMRAKARAMASEARASTAILGSLPVLVTIMLMFTSPTYIAPMFSDVRGLILFGIAVGMLLTGVGIMVKMARFEI